MVLSREPEYLVNMKVKPIQNCTVELEVVVLDMVSLSVELPEVLLIVMTT